MTATTSRLVTSGRSDGFPVAAMQSVQDGSLADAEFTAERAGSVDLMSGGIVLPDVFHVGRCQLGAIDISAFRLEPSVCRPARHAALCCSVAHVVSTRPGKQMSWIHAGRIVAVMADEQASAERPMRALIAEAVRHRVLGASPEMCSASRAPIPAACLRIDGVEASESLVRSASRREHGCHCNTRKY